MNAATEKLRTPSSNSRGWPEPGTMVGGVYRVVGPLGQGGMGVVVVAHDELLDRDVAIKFIRKELSSEPELRERFMQEARAMARVRHPNVLPIYSFGEFEETPYFVTELIAGQTVEQWLRARPAGTFPDMATALHIIEETCNGVEAIHAARTVHRDLKPSNLLLDSDFRVRVADLGVAGFMRRGGDERRDIVGTPDYMAPENVLQMNVPDDLVHRADVYSLGCLTYELLTGQSPFGAKGKGALGRMLARVIAETTPRPSEVRPDLGPEFDDVIARALAKDPAERIPTAQALKRALVSAFKKAIEPVRILVADDDDDFRTLLSHTLSNEFPDATIECVRNGRDALDAFDSRCHSAAIIDLQMPDLDGLELTGLLRARDAAHAVPIIVITASGGPAEWKQLSALGADGFLVKPVNVKDVITLVRRSLQERVSENSLRPPPPPSSSTKAARPVVDPSELETKPDVFVHPNARGDDTLRSRT